MDVFSLFLMAVIGGVVVAQALDAYPRLVRVERVAVWWWASVCVLALVSLLTQDLAYRAAAGILMSGFGLLVALNVQQIAEHLARRQTGFLGLRKRSHSGTTWRLCALLLIVFGPVWGFASGEG